MNRPGAISYSATPSRDFIAPLEGLRGVAVGIVMLSHLGLGDVFPGEFGVNVFFLISGFLITRLLLDEQARSGRIRLGAFWMRRVLRLYPALLGLVVLGGGIYAAMGGWLSVGQVAAALLYMTNFAQIYWVNYATHLPGVFHPFSVLWSLAVEEHFYLLYPTLVLLVGGRRGRLAGLLLGLIIAGAIWSDMVWHITAPALREERVLLGTDTRISAILAGALLATLLGTSLGPRLLRWLGGPWAAALAIALLLASLLLRNPDFRGTWRFSVQSVGLFIGVGALLYAPWLGFARRLLSHRVALWAGRWSYSLYLWHPIAKLLVMGAVPAWAQAAEMEHYGLGWFAIGLPVSLLLSCLFAGLSYRFVEAPVLALRRRWGAVAAM